MTRIAIVGAGAIGGCAAAHLSSHQLTLCTRRPLGALTVETPDGVRTPAFANALDPAAVEAHDWVLLCTKAHQTEGAAGWLAALCRPPAVLAVLQNGVEHRERVAPFVRDVPVLPVVVDCPAVSDAPGRVRQTRRGTITVPATDEGRAFVALFSDPLRARMIHGPTEYDRRGASSRRSEEGASSLAVTDERRTDAPQIGGQTTEAHELSGLEARVSEDFTTELWRKLCLNVPGAILALTAQPLGVLRRDDLAALARGLILETAAVARAEGARLDDAVADEIIQAMQRGNTHATPSILQDTLRRQPLEHDARNGAVVRIGARHGIATPLNTALTALLAGLSSGF